MASVLLRENLEDCCRTCLNDLTVKMYGLFDEKEDSLSVVKILTMFTNIQVQPDDPLPKNLCNSCYNCVSNFYDFKVLAEKADQQLRKHYSIITSQTALDDYKEVSIKNELTDNDDNDYENDCDIKVKNESSESDEDFTLKTLANMKELHKNKVKKKVLHRYNCSMCSKKFRVHKRYLDHLSIHDKEDLINGLEACDVCSATFSSKNSLAAHKRIHVPKGRVLSCQICGRIFKKMSHVKRHELSHETNRPFKCTICPKSFFAESVLKYHVDKHLGIKPHKCPVCKKEFTHLSILNNHVKLHTRGKMYLCTTCGKCFDSNTNLSQHVKRHLGLKNFECDLCPSKFVSKGELSSHRMTHSGVKPYSCELCKSTFTKSTSLKKHRLKHLGIKAFQCDTCPMKFTTNEYLKTHYRIHTGEKPFKCDMCERAFTQSGDLLKHKRIHLGTNLYKCDQCPESFRLKSELRSHVTDHYLSVKVPQPVQGHLSKNISPDTK